MTTSFLRHKHCITRRLTTITLYCCNNNNSNDDNIETLYKDRESKREYVDRKGHFIIICP